MVNVGGFFASLQIKADTKSISDAVGAVDKIRESVSKAHEGFGTFIKGALQGLLALGAAALGASGAVAMIQAKNSISASIAGETAQQYTNWANAAHLVGVETNAINAAASKMQN